MIAIVRNYFYDGFSAQADAMKKAFEDLGEEAKIYDNMSLLLMKDSDISFSKCVFFDKDISLGLRLETLGVRLYNNIGSIELCDDKRRTNEILRRDCKVPETIPFPLSYYASEKDLNPILNEIAVRLGFPLVAKEAYGSLGMQVTLLNNLCDLKEYMNKHIFVPHLYQKFISNSRGRDMRLYVVGGKTVAAIERRNDRDFRANIALGGKAMPITPTEKQCKAAEDSAALLGLDFCGVDLLYSDNDNPYICEVNSNALFAGISSATCINIASIIARHVVEDVSSFDNIL